MLEHFYEKAQLHEIWERHRANYAALVNRYHEPLAKMVFDTDIYLRLQSGGYLGSSGPRRSGVHQALAGLSLVGRRADSRLVLPSPGRALTAFYLGHQVISCSEAAAAKGIPPAH